MRRQGKKGGPEEIKAVIASPDNLQETIRGRRNTFKTVGERLLQVTYKPERERMVVITAIDKKR